MHGEVLHDRPGGYELKLSPGSEVYDTEDSQAGHMMLPCSQFREASRRQRKDEAQVFLVGDYFSPGKSSAVLRRLPDTKAEGNRKTTSALLNDALGFLKKADALS